MYDKNDLNLRVGKSSPKDIARLKAALASLLASFWREKQTSGAVVGSFGMT